MSDLITPRDLGRSPIRVKYMREVLHELADADYQARLWRAQIPDEQSSWNEAYEVLWDDSALAEALRHGEVFSEQIDHKLLRLLALMDEVEDYPDLDKLLSSAHMRAVRAAAAELIPLLDGFAI